MQNCTSKTASYWYGMALQRAALAHVIDILGLVVQLALWEEYADEVEEQMRVLLADNALLQAALADVRSSLAHERPNSASASGAHPASGDVETTSPC